MHQSAQEQRCLLLKLQVLHLRDVRKQGFDLPGFLVWLAHLKAPILVVLLQFLKRIADALHGLGDVLMRVGLVEFGCCWVEGEPVGQSLLVGEYLLEVLHEVVEHAVGVVAPHVCEGRTDVQLVGHGVDQRVVQLRREEELRLLRGEVMQVEGELEPGVLEVALPDEDDAVPN